MKYFSYEKSYASKKRHDLAMSQSHDLQTKSISPNFGVHKLFEMKTGSLGNYFRCLRTTNCHNWNKLLMHFAPLKIMTVADLSPSQGFDPLTTQRAPFWYYFLASIFVASGNLLTLTPISTNFSCYRASRTYN